MENEKLLDTLFEKAREQEPEKSYDEVALGFIAAVPTAKSGGAIKSLLKNINLNSILMISVSSFLIATVWLAFSLSSEKQTPQPQMKNSNIMIPIDTVEKTEFQIIESNDTNFEEGILKRSAELTPLKEKKEIEPLFQKPIVNDLVVINETLQSERLKESLAVQEPVSKSKTENLKDEPVKHEKVEPKRMELAVKRTSISITSDADEDEMNKFLAEVEKLGLDSDLDWDYSKRKKVLKGFKLILKNDDGLDFQMRVKGFDRFELAYELDENKAVKKLFYTFNKEQLVEIKLTERSRVTHSWDKF